MFSFREPLQTKLWIPAVVPQHPDPDLCAVKVIEERIGKSIQIAAAEPAPVKMKTARVFDPFPDTDPKLGEKVLAELPRHIVIRSKPRPGPPEYACGI